MKKLKLPIIKGVISKEKILSMDEYIEFVQFNLENLFDKESYFKWKEIIAVNAPFKLI